MEERYCLPDWFLRHRRLTDGAWAPWGVSGNGRGSGGVNNFNGFKDHLGFIYRMNLAKIVEVHDGCVNTIVWNDQGRLILSGSDDLLLKITDPFQPKVLTSIRSGHRSNIFKARFLPFSDDAKIVSCSGDGHLMYTEVHRPETHGTFRFTCHQGSTSTVETIHNDPFSFLSCGEDGTVRHFDIRTETSYRKRNTNHAVIYKSCGSVSAMAVNQLVPHQLAVCCTDGVVRLLDRRYMYGGTLSDSGTGGSRSNRDLKASFLRFSPLKSSHDKEGEEGAGSVGAVRRRMTSVAFCPSGGHEVLVSYSGDSLYLFGLDGKQRELPLAPRETSRGSKGLKHSCCTVREKAPKTDQNLALETSRGSNNNANRKSFFQRLRIRGDWSDTGPSARPLGVTSNSEDNSVSEQNNNSADNERQTVTATANPEAQPVPEEQQNASLGYTEPQVPTGSTSSSSQGRGQQSQLVRRGRQATLARFSTLLNQMLVEQFATAADIDDTHSSHETDSPVDLENSVHRTSADTSDRGEATRRQRTLVYEEVPSVTSRATESENTASLSSQHTVTSNQRYALPSEEVYGNTPSDESPQGSALPNNSAQHSISSDLRGPNKIETRMEIDEECQSDVAISYEEQRRAYVREVREEVANAPLIDTCEDASGEAQGGETHSNTLVFVREPSSGIPSPPNQTSNVMVYMSPHSRNTTTLVDQTSTVPTSQVQNSSNLQSQTSESLASTNAAVQIESNEVQNSPRGPNLHTDDNAVSSVPRGSQDVDSGAGVPQGSQVGDSGAIRSAEQRWASVADDLMGMIRSRNRASNSRSAAAAIASRRNRLELQLPRSPHLSADSQSDQVQDSTTRYQLAGSEDEDEEDSEGEEQEKKDAEIWGLLRLKNAAVRMKFSGHRNTRTMIKQANFWGDDYVITGSDCGHVFFYERQSGKLVTILEADSHVVNCVQPHPSKCILASSGIDYNVKLWMPTGPPGLGPPGHMLELVERNVVMQRQTRDLITVPASFMLRLLAMATPATRAPERASSTTTGQNSSEETQDINRERVQQESTQPDVEERHSNSTENEETSNSGDDNSFSVHSDHNV